MSALSKETIIGILGAGAMGTGIAQVAATAGHKVLLFDIRPDGAAEAIGRIIQILHKLVEKGKMDTGEAQAISSRLDTCSTLADLSECGLLIEAVVEEVSIKASLLAEAEQAVPPTTILATNTSSLSVTELSAALSRPAQFAGLHFFNPAPLMPLVEVVAGLNTSDATVQALADTMARWGKSPVCVQNAPGFIVNRGARPYYSESLRFVEERGVDFISADALLKSLGFRMGPFELIDLVGLDINLAASGAMWQAYYSEPRYKPSILVEERVAAGQLGRKAGQGFYKYPAETEPVAKTLPTYTAPREVAVHGELGPAADLFQISRAAGVEIDRAQGDGWMLLDGTKMALTDGRMAAERGPGWVLFDLALNYAETKMVAITASKGADIGLAVGYFQALGKEVVQVADLPGMLSARTICMVINEACESLLRGIARKEDIDTAMQKGLNFPGGPLQWADKLGLDYLLRVLDNMAKAYGDDRYRASVLLRRMVANGEKFYG